MHQYKFISVANGAPGKGNIYITIMLHEYDIIDAFFFTNPEPGMF